MTNKNNLYILLTLSWSLTIILVFWLSFRYPSLDSKLAQSTITELSGIGFDKIAFYIKDASFLHNVIITFINWVSTNINGMVFGIFFGASVVSLFRYIQPPTNLPTYKSIPISALAGASLGVCANCATPIANSFYHKGFKSSFTTTLLISSPLLNPIVITMIFSLFPIQVFIAYLLFTFILITLINLIQPHQHQSSSPKPLQPVISPITAIPTDLFLFIIKIVPIMLLAALLGAVVFELLPTHLLLNDFSIVYAVIIALMSTLLPVPIAFNVFFAMGLLSTGIDIRYVFIFLTTLAAYSVYPLIILYKEISRSVAITLALSIPTISIIIALLLPSFHSNSSTNHISRLNTIMSSHEDKTFNQYLARITNPLKKFDTASPLMPATPKPIIKVSPSKLYQLPQSTTPHSPLSTLPSYIETNLRFLRSGVSTLDINNDGWIDIFYANTDSNPTLLINNKKGSFVPASPDFFDNTHFRQVMSLTPYDYDSDGDLDVLMLLQFQKPILLINTGKTLIPKTINTKTLNTHLFSAVAVGDINNDGTLEAIISGSSSKPPHLTYNEIYPEHNVKSLILDSNLNTTEFGQSGYSFASILIDINNDNFLDFISTNDFSQDVLYHNKKGYLVKSNSHQSQLGDSSISSMSIDSTYLPNESNATIFTTADSHTSYLDVCSTTPTKQCPSINKFNNAIRNLDSSECYNIKNNVLFSQCFHHLSRFQQTLDLKNISPDAQLDNNGKYKSTHLTYNNKPLSNYFLKFNYLDYDLIAYSPTPDKINFITYKDNKSSPLTSSITNPNQYYPTISPTLPPPTPLIFKSTNANLTENNTLITIKPNGSHKTLEGEYQSTGTAWASLFIDLNNDKYPELYSLNSDKTGPFKQLNNNQVFAIRDNKFVITKDYPGLNINKPSSSLAFADFDNDGDPDILIGTTWDGLHLWNNPSENNFVSFELNSKSKNTYGIGAKITIHTDDGFQTKEIKLSGGFLGFSHPRAYFGLGEYKKIIKVDVNLSGKEYTFKNIKPNTINTLVLK